MCHRTRVDWKGDWTLSNNKQAPGWGNKFKNSLTGSSGTTTWLNCRWVSTLRPCEGKWVGRCRKLLVLGNTLWKVNIGRWSTTKPTRGTTGCRIDLGSPPEAWGSLHWGFTICVVLTVRCDKASCSGYRNSKLRNTRTTCRLLEKLRTKRTN